MARVLLGPLVCGIKQRIGATVHQGTPGGTTARTLRAKARSRTGFQMARRSEWTTTARLWTTALTQAQRDAWSAFAALHPITDVFGQNIILSGFDFFMRLGRPLATIAIGPLLTPPANLTVTQQGPPSVSLSHIGPTYRITGYAPALAAGEYLQIFAGPPMPAGRGHAAIRYTFIQAHIAPATPPLDFATNYGQHYNFAQSGQKIPVQIRVLNPTNGAKSLFTTTIAVVV
jgi:hypothetical protein